MTHADYVAAGYAPVYEISEPGENLDGTYHVLELDRTRPARKQITKEHTCATLAEAEGVVIAKTEEMAHREIDEPVETDREEYYSQAYIDGSR